MVYGPSQQMNPVLEKLDDPPIVEVVCGLHFQPISELDSLLLGVYWKQRAADYPGRQLHPALSDENIFVLGPVAPLRVWLVSRDQAFLIQLQADRFYLNWRAIGAKYPRFSDHEGEKGLLTRLMDEFEIFSKFCFDHSGQWPKVVRLELSKIDLLSEPRHWSGFSDLAKAVPWLSQFVSFSRSHDPTVSVQFSEKRGEGKLTVSLSTGIQNRPAEGPSRFLKIESRIVREVQNDGSAIKYSFEEANRDINEIFSSMIPDKERLARFQRGDR